MARKRGSGAARGIRFEVSPEVEAIARGLINTVESHGQLAEARIVYLLRFGTWKDTKGSTRLGSAERGSPKMMALVGEKVDFIITVNGDRWQFLPESARTAVVDHELSHCYRKGIDVVGNPMWGITGHDVEEFSGVIRRHGLWMQNLQGFAEAVRASDQQLTIDDLARQNRDQEIRPVAS